MVQNSDKKRGILEIKSKEKDLWVFLTDDLKWKTHIDYACSKANKKLGLIKHTFKHLDVNTMKLLHTSLVRHILDYAAPIWSPYLKQDIKKLEQIQHRATKIKGLKRLSYEDTVYLQDCVVSFCPALTTLSGSLP